MDFSTLEFYEWENKGPDDILSLKGATLSDNPEVRKQIRDLSRSGAAEILELKDGLRIKTTSFVGRFQIDRFQISILPKLKGMLLLRLLRYAYGLRDLRIMDQTTYALENLAFHDLLLYQLVTEVSELIMRGLHRSYLRKEEDLTELRGRINIQRYARMSRARSNTLPCIHFPRENDSLVNQILLAGLNFGARLTEDILLRTRLRRLARMMEESVSDVILDGHLLRTVRRGMNRLTRSYEPAITIIEALVQQQAISLDDETVNLTLPGFLFDMNLFWQALLSRFFHENLTGCKITDEYVLKGMFSYQAGYNPQNRKSPRPRPDFVIEDGKRSVTLDAKYRDLSVKSLPRDMLYQLSIYALANNDGKRASILYPTLSEDEKESRIDIREPKTGLKIGEVTMRPVSLPKMDKLLYSPGFETKHEKAGYAQHLAFGRY